MRRTQMYLDDDLWEALRARAKRQRTTVSELVRQAARDRYLNNLEERRAAMEGIVGIRKDWPGKIDSTAYVRSLRKGSRLDRLSRGRSG